MTQNILQPQQDTNSQEFVNSLCEALLHTTNNDNTARAQAEQYMTQASKSPGCLASLLQIATSNQVSAFWHIRDGLSENLKKPAKFRSASNMKLKVVIRVIHSRKLV